MQLSGPGELREEDPAAEAEKWCYVQCVYAEQVLTFEAAWERRSARAFYLFWVLP